MSYLHEVLKSDARTVIEDLIKSGDYEKAHGGVKDIIAEIRSQESGYGQAKKLYLLLKFETYRLKRAKIVISDRTREVLQTLDSGDFEGAVTRAKAALKELRGTEHEFTLAENALYLLESEIDRVTAKGVIIPYTSSGVKDLIAKGSYGQAKAEAEETIRKIREIDGWYDTAMHLFGVIRDEIAYFEERGIILPADLNELSGLIEEGRYQEAIPVARALLELLWGYGDNFLERLRKELERCRDSGLVIPFGTGDVEEALGKGDYVSARDLAEKLFININSIESDYKSAMDVLNRLKRETARLNAKGVVFTDESERVESLISEGRYVEARDEGFNQLLAIMEIERKFDGAVESLSTMKEEGGRLSEKGVVFADESDAIDSMMGSGEYDKAIIYANALLVTMLSAEKDYDAAMEAYGALESEMKRLLEEGIVIPDETGTIRDHIASGDYRTARSETNAITVKIVSIAKDYEAAMEALNALKEEILRLHEKGVVFPDDITEIEDLIARGIYHDARIKANNHELRIRLVESDYDFAVSVLNVLEVEIERLGAKGVVIRVETGPVQEQIDAGNYDESRKEAESGLTKLWAADSDFESAIEALQALKQEYDRVRTKGVIVTDESDQVEALIKEGEYHKSRSRAELLHSAIRKAEDDYESAIEARKGLLAESERLKGKGVVFDDSISSIDQLIDSGEYEDARKSIEETLRKLRKVERDFDSATETLEQFDSECTRLKDKGVVFTTDVSKSLDLMKGGRYIDARKKADEKITEILMIEAEFDSAMSAYTAYKREIARAGMNEIPVTDESGSIESLHSSGKYKDARLEAEALLSRAKSFIWEYELAIRSYDSLVREIERLKGEGIIITEDPSQVQEFIGNGSYQQAKSIAEGLHSRIKGTEWEYQLAVRSHEELKRIVDEIKEAGEEPAVGLAELEQWIERGDYRKAKSVAEDIANILFK